MDLNQHKRHLHKPVTVDIWFHPPLHKHVDPTPKGAPASSTNTHVLEMVGVFGGHPHSQGVQDTLNVVKGERGHG